MKSCKNKEKEIDNKQFNVFSLLVCFSIMSVPCCYIKAVEHWCDLKN